MKKTVFALILGCLLSNQGWSASVLKMDIDDLVKRSDVAIVGKVKQISHRNETGRYPETLFKVEVLETFYGSENLNEVTLCLPGGPAGDGLTTFVPGMPKFQVGEKAALFLVLDRDRGVAVPTGLEQGVFRVKIHPETEEEYVVNQTVEIKLDSVGAGSGKTAKGGSKLSLSEFGSTIKTKAAKLKKDK